MTNLELIREWIARFNRADVEGIMELYAENAINHQVVTDPLVGRDAIRRLFEVEFGRAKMTCIEESLLETADGAVLEWRDPTGLRGCGIFQIADGKIVHQRGYFDQLSFFRLQGMDVPESYL